ncbi:hypothetical protein [Fuerstiella marisgermanici]|uniref:Glycerophosphoryl diester phosphodiesterase membrane domain-containing protein n=1 Tax=Fuerstiella marisgermanici TaxID=1891926 RepID=A0A1P8WDQ1_9PLAN|nr:hypothetical protein [Fuerstiella marisgermanici]APZ92192.1 hypothetical protein Fuma_01801 [Fuerstiella marisgermanici]
MKVEDCIVTVERRTTGGCIDLALVFARQFARPLLNLTLCFAVPCTVLVWFVSTSMREIVLLPCMLIFAFFNMLLSGAIVATAGPQVFGVPISTRVALKGLLSRIVLYAFLGMLMRVTGFCMVFPLLFVMAGCGHLPEVMFLERTPLKHVSERLSWLSKGGGFSRNLGRLTTITLTWFTVAAGVFIMFDFLSGLLLNHPIFFGSIAWSPDIFEAVTSKFIDDPSFVIVLQMSLWVTYPIARLAWFFCYLDQRIRNECWDLELQFRVEAARLEEQMA